MNESSAKFRPGAREERAIYFGPFQLLPRRRILLEDGKPLHLGSRALDLLIVLVERAGDIVGKDELIARVWPNTAVDEANLRVHMAALRKSLGDGRGGSRYITNIVGRGYSFIADVDRGQVDAPRPDIQPASERSHRLPAALNRIIGRAEIIDAVADRLKSRRLVTIVGSPGIGKTTVAVAVCDALTDFFQDEIRFIDFSSISDSKHLASAVASALGLPVLSDDPFNEILGFLADKRMLLLLDNCEHVIEAAAVMAEGILRRTENIHICATSREPLRAEGEWTQRLVPLPAPSDAEELTVAAALRFPAIELFVERASSSQDTFEIADGNVAAIASICRHLDGVPLAIELVAARVDMFGVRELESLATDRFMLLAQGRRTAQPRQQTLGAALDWSFSILSAREQAVLRRAAIFRGAFTIESAAAVTGFDMSFEQAFEAIVSLAAKSLLMVDASGEEVRYRLLEMTRAFALEKLRIADESSMTSERHASHFLDLMRKGGEEVRSRRLPDWLKVYGRNIDDIRAAMEWAFSKGGDRSVGAELTAAATPLFFQLALTEELRTRIEHALECLAQITPTNPELELQLRTALGTAIYNIGGATPELEKVTAKALEVAEHLGPGPHQLPALWGVIRERYIAGDYPRMMRLIDRFGELARDSGDDEAIFIHARMLSFGLHLVGRHAEGRLFAEQAVAPPAKTLRLGYESLYQYDHGVMGRCHLARILWVQGFPDQAVRLSREALEVAHSIDSKLLICSALTLSVCPIALWTHDLGAARRAISELLAASSIASLRYWNSWGRLYERALWIRQGLAAAEESPNDTKSMSALQIEMLSTLDPALAGPLARARAENGAAAWNTPEVFRAVGEQALARRSLEVCGIEQMLLRSLQLARQQEALSWELRGSMSLARLWCDHGRRDDAKDLVKGVCGRFSEGWGTGDLVAATNLVAELTS